MAMTLFCLTVLALLGGEDAAQLEVRLPASEDQVELTATDEAVVVEVVSPRGIGRATLVPVDGVWPEQVMLRLGLGDLEGLSVSTPEVHLESFLDAESTQIHRTDEDNESLPGDDELQLVIRHAGEGVIEVELPPALLEHGPAEIEIHWVDWYR